MAVITKVASSTQPKQLRPFDAVRDSEAVADLIELCFTNTLDPDGRRYLHHMRASARTKGLSRWVSLTVGAVPNSLSGFVWEEDGKVVGNLSLIPFFFQGQWIYLIANVAVRPEYRRRGIAQALTIAALDKSRQRHVKTTWLQVRHENDAALNLYLKMGFVPQARRTTWVATPGLFKGQIPSDLWVTTRKRQHWHLQRSWFNQNYPQRLHWFFQLNMATMKPGIQGAWHRMLSEIDVWHWAVLNDSELLGVLSLQESHRYADYLWLAAPPAYEDQVLEAVLPIIRREPRLNRPISLDFPENRAVDTLLSLGFEQKATLIWMEANHTSNSSYG